MKILLVEDSATLRHAMSEAIRKAGHEALYAETGELALQIIEAKPVDMVIMDVEMPGLDGFETTRLIRESQSQWLPIIFVTGKQGEDNLRRGIEVGGDDYLIKPVSDTILTAKIRAMERIAHMQAQLTELNAELLELSERDSLTKLLNRRTFEQRAQEKWRHAVRSGQSLAVLILDIDHFKAYNDLYGHLAGDDCIRRVAFTLSQCLGRPEDLLARYGGEEFIALLPETELEGAEHVAERLRRQVAALDIRHRGAVGLDRITLSVGGAVMIRPSGQQLVEQMSAADRALYVSKAQGRNRVTVRIYSPAPLVLLASADSALATALSQQLLNRARMVVAEDSKSLVDAALCQRPELIVVDDQLGGQAGFDAALAVRENAMTAHIPILLLDERATDQGATWECAARTRYVMDHIDKLLPEP